MKIHQFNSLRARLVVWILLPSLLIILIDALLVYQQSRNTAILVEDNLLLASAKVISQQVKVDDNFYEIITPPAAFEMLADDYRDKVYFSVRDKSSFLFAGSAELVYSSKVDLNHSDDAYFSTLNSEPIRVVSYFYRIPNSEADFVVTTVAKTLGAYHALTNSLFWNTIKIHFLMLIVLMTSLSLALKWTMKPINRLADELKNRSSRDLRPLTLADAPDELAPVIQSINDYVSRLKKNTQSYEEFLQNAAHHLRTSYAIINAEIEIAMRSAHQNQHSNLSIANLKRQVAAGVKIVNDLLMLASMEKANDSGIFINGKKERVNLAEVIVTILEKFAPVAFQKDISLNVITLDTTLEIVETPRLIEELISNLIDNAIQHIPNGREIFVALNTAVDGIVLQISDNGHGIPDEELDNVFQRFYRLDSTRTASSGLGLSIVREICEFIGATVSLSRRPSGEGLLVEIVFKNISIKAM